MNNRLFGVLFNGEIPIHKNNFKLGGALNLVVIAVLKAQK